MANVDGIASDLVIPSPTVYLGLYVIPDGVGDESAVDSPTVLIDQIINPESISAEDEYGTPFIYTPLDQSVYLVTANSGPEISEPIVSYTQQAIVTGISDSGVGEPTVWVDPPIEVEVRGIGAADNIGSITLIIDNQNIEPVGIESENVFGNAVVDRPLLVDQSLYPDGIATQEVVSDAQAKVNQTVTVTGIDTAESVGQQTVFLAPTVITVPASNVLESIGFGGTITKPAAYFEFSSDTAKIEVGGFARWTTQATVEGADWFVED